MSYNPWSTTDYAAYRRSRYAAAHPDGGASAQTPPPVLPPQDPPAQDPPPAVTPAEPTAASFDLATSDPEGWARYQRGVAGEVDKDIEAERAATLAVLPPLRGDQNMYFLYVNGKAVKKYTPAQARRLKPEEAAKLTPVEVKAGLIKDTYHGMSAAGYWFEDAGAEIYGDVAGTSPDDLDTRTPIADAERAAGRAASDAAYAAKNAAESAGGAIADGVEAAYAKAKAFLGGLLGFGGDLASLMEWLVKYTPYLLMIGAAGTVVYVATPLVSAARSASSGRRRRTSRPE